MVRVGFLGCGFIARYHLMQLALSPVRCEVVACHDPDERKVQSFIGHIADDHPRLGAPDNCESPDLLLASVDAVFVCTWTATHLDLVSRAARAGVAVFCEKPLGVDLIDAVAVAEALSRAPTQMVGLVLRSSPAFLALRELVHEQGAGAVMNVVFRDDQYLPVGGMYGSTWRADAALSGSGALLEHSIHDVDILEWLVAPMAAVSARQAFVGGLEGIEDSVSVLGTFTNGASFTLASVWHDVADRPSQRRVEVFCQNRLVTLEGDIFGPVSVHTSEGVTTYEGDALVEWLDSRGVELVSAEQLFLGSVEQSASRGGVVRRLRPDAGDALRAHVLVDAMYRSARAGGQPVGVLPSDA
jgi:predicted dehydrogenase